MRLFVAVGLSGAAVAEAQRVADALRRAPGAADLRWAPAANMHVTLRFVGHVADDQEALVAELARPAARLPFDITLGACGAFPASGAVRVVWIGFAGGGPELAQLSALFDDRLRRFGFEPETRPFSAHLTLARAAKDARVPGAFRDTLARVVVNPVSTRVDRAVLYRSHLSPHGARYEPLASIPLVAKPS